MNTQRPFVVGSLVGLISMLLCLGIERLKERRDEGTHTQFISFAVCYGQGLWHSRTTTIVRSKITDYRSSHENMVIEYSTNMIMKKFEVLQELPKCETEIHSE